MKATARFGVHIGMVGILAFAASAQISFQVVWSKSIGGGMENGEISPDGKVCALGLTAKGVRLWQTSDGREIGSLPVYTAACSWEKCQEIESMAWSGDGKYLACGGNGQPVLIYDMIAKKQVFSQKTSETDGMRGHPGGRWFAIADKGTVMQVAVPEMRVLARVSGHSCGINSFDFSLDGKTMVSGACDRKIVVWNVSGTSISKAATLSAPNSVKTTRVTGDGRYILGACGDAMSVVLWNRTGQKLGEVKTPGYCDHAEFSPDGSVLVTQAKGADLLVYSVPGLKLVKSIRRGGNGEYMNWRGRQLLVLGGGVITMYSTSGYTTPPTAVAPGVTQRAVAMRTAPGIVSPHYSLSGTLIPARADAQRRAVVVEAVNGRARVRSFAAR